MWYKNNFLRHLCDMHIHDWDPSFLSKFSPESYVKNLKTAHIQNAMLYFQSHVGLCYYPTKSGKMHQGFAGKEDAMQKTADLCHENGISVTGYYSVIYNTWAHDKYPAWRLVHQDGKSDREKGELLNGQAYAAQIKAARYGLCCPNNPDYRAFVKTQIKEMLSYFTVDGMFYDMLFWPHLCYCEHCKQRWADEAGGELPAKEDWTDARWLFHLQKRREWMGEFAQFLTDYTKSLKPQLSVEHNVSHSATPFPCTANAEEVLHACDYAGGDLYVDPYTQSFACKFYRSITKNQPFEYMFSRCAPDLGAHTQLKSEDILKSAAFLTCAHHGATLVIDAIDPVGTQDKRVYERIGKVFSEILPYENEFVGNPLSDIGIYYSLKSKFLLHGEPYSNYTGVTNTVRTMVENNLLCDIAGGFTDLSRFPVLIAPLLTSEDTYDNDRLLTYVENGGKLYFSGAGAPKLLHTFFGAKCEKRTAERIVYLAPKGAAQAAFGYFNETYPLHFDGSAPIVCGIDQEAVLATVTLPYTNQDTVQFASIHSNPPGIQTGMPALAVTTYGKGTVLWSALPIESIPQYDTKKVFLQLLQAFLHLSPTVTSDAPKDVELTAFRTEHGLQLNAVLLNEEERARKTTDFSVTVTCDFAPKSVTKLPDRQPVEADIKGNSLCFPVKNLGIFAMYEIK